MALREGNSALKWADTRPEDNTHATAVAGGHFVQVGFPTAALSEPAHFDGERSHRTLA